MKDDFIAVLSHELRTPLNAIMSWTHVLRQRGGNAETMRGLAAIERNGTTQARMISDLLDMSRLNLGKLPLTFVTIDPVEEVVAVGQRDAAGRRRAAGRASRCRLAPPYRPIRADASRLQQVIWNLLSNAIKFSPPGGRIVVGAGAGRARPAHAASADEGQGIAPEFLPFVFDRFAQSDAASNRQRGGLGLGLSIVKQLVEAHGGTVSATSPGLGHGATFDVWLPADPAHPGPRGGSRLEPRPRRDRRCRRLAGGPAAAGGGRRSRGQRDAAHHPRRPRRRRCRPRNDVAVGAATAGRAAVRRARSATSAWPARTATTSSARCAARRPRSRCRQPHLPAIALTSFTREQDRAQALAAGFDAHCGKPLRPLSLMQQIRALLDHRALSAGRCAARGDGGRQALECQT